MNEVQGASTVKNVSLKSAKIILSTEANVYADYQDHNFPKKEMRNYLKKIASNLSNRSTQKTVKRRVPAVNNPEKVGSKKNEMVMKAQTKYVLHRAN